MNAATNVKQVQGNHTPINPIVGFVALMEFVVLFAIAAGLTYLVSRK